MIIIKFLTIKINIIFKIKQNLL